MKTIQELKEEIEFEKKMACNHCYGCDVKDMVLFCRRKIEKLKAQLKARKEALEDELGFLDEIEKFNMCNACDDVYKKLVQERINKIKEELK